MLPKLTKPMQESVDRLVDAAEENGLLKEWGIGREVDRAEENFKEAKANLELKIRKLQQRVRNLEKKVKNSSS